MQHYFGEWDERTMLLSTCVKTDRLTFMFFHVVMGSDSATESPDVSQVPPGEWRQEH